MQFTDSAIPTFNQFGNVSPPSSIANLPGIETVFEPRATVFEPRSVSFDAQVIRS